MDFDVGYLGALVAGLLSFASPCVLPLVPPYLCFLGGVTLDQLAGKPDAAPDAQAVRRVVIAAVAFVLGFTTIFVVMGASASALSQLLIANAGWLSKIAGAVIIAFGLHFLGLFRLRLLDREARVHVERRPTGPAGAYVAGLAFAFGWTPCVGPVLATILTVAAGREELWEGATLLFVYSLGIGLPFLGAAFFAGPFLRLMRRWRAQLGRVEQVMGAFLVLTGLLILLGSFDDIGYWLLRTFPSLGRIG